MESLVLIGGGGHCRSCIDVIEAGGRFRIVGIVDARRLEGDGVFGYPWLGSDDQLPAIVEDCPNALIAVGQIKSPDARRALFELLRGLGATLPVVISPRAYVSRHAAVAPGAIVMHDAILNAGATVGANSIINTMSLIEHDAHVAAHCHISTGARINGGATVGAGSFIGSGALVHQNVQIGERVIVGAGCIVNTDLPAGSIIRP